ncbi:MAG: hypothetical protein EZS28_054638, partial [Streblomastix strix]
VHPPQLVTRTFDVSSYDLSQMGKSGEMDRAMRQMGVRGLMEELEKQEEELRNDSG